MPLLAIALTALALADSVPLEERIDLYEPTSGAFLGSERTWFGADERRLRQEVRDAQGALTLLFIVRHDDQGRESEAIFFEGGAGEPSREVFSWSADGRQRTTTYFYESGVAADRTESELDGAGREVHKRYYRADGSQYGEEDVLWDAGGNALGWDFRYVEREGGTSFRYVDAAFDEQGQWTRRVRERDDVPERLEVRSLVTGTMQASLPTPARFAPGRVSTTASESSPSFSRDGATLVFARYGDDWTRKQPFIAFLEEDGWRVEPLTGLGTVYNLAISPDGRTIVHSTRSEAGRTLFRSRRTEDGWSRLENLSERYGLVGTYPCLTEDGALFFYDSEGPAGAGIYSAEADGEGFGAVETVFVPTAGAPFDAYLSHTRGSLLVTRCFDDVCESGPQNGIWQVSLDEAGGRHPAKLPNLPYAWGAQPVEALGLFVFTDGDDILVMPLDQAGG